jgi:hypothetical protein
MTEHPDFDSDHPAAEAQPDAPPGHDIRTLGPSDSSDTGADVAESTAGGTDHRLESNSDRHGTGERTAAGGEEVRVGGDIAPDRIVSGEQAGLGVGLDEAEEAQLGIPDEEPSDAPDNQT